MAFKHVVILCSACISSAFLASLIQGTKILHETVEYFIIIRHLVILAFFDFCLIEILTVNYCRNNHGMKIVSAYK